MSFPISAVLLDAIVLSVVAQEPEGTYGYKITQQVTHTLELIREGEPPVKRKIITLDTEIVERESTKRGIKNSLKYLDW